MAGSGSRTLSHREESRDCAASPPMLINMEALNQTHQGQLRWLLHETHVLKLNLLEDY